MNRATTPYWWEATVRYHDLDWKVLGVKGNMRLIRLLGSYHTVRVSVATLDLNNP